jgi:hypothetical protein
MVTPDITASHVLEFATRINHNSIIYVPVRPHPASRRSFCEDNALRIVEQYGGAAAYGWLLSEWPGVYISAMTHVVWRNPEGRYIDPTPHSMGFTKVVFLPDDSLEQKFIGDSKDHALIDDPLVSEFLEQARLGAIQIARTESLDSELQLRIRALLERIESKYGKEPRGDRFL